MQNEISWLNRAQHLSRNSGQAPNGVSDRIAHDSFDHPGLHSQLRRVYTGRLRRWNRREADRRGVICCDPPLGSLIATRANFARLFSLSAPDRMATMSSWVAVSFGALDVRSHEFGADRYEYVVTPVRPGEPVMLHGVGADIWRRLVDGPVADAELSAEERHVIEDMDSMGIASRDAEHIGRIRSVDKPWLLSPIHELVYALLQKLAEESRIRLIFIKGPTLHAQGLRTRIHSGDVDCWVEPGSERRFARAMQAWGWKAATSAFTGTRVLHSLTMRANQWSCAVDVHSWFPGMSVSPSEAFDAVYGGAETRTFASTQSLTPSTEFHAVIGSLNVMRPIRGQLPSAEAVATAAEVLRQTGEIVIEPAATVGAEFALAAPLQAAFPDQRLDLSNATVPPDWAWRLERSAVRAYLAALRIVPWRDRPRVVFRIIWPTAESLRAGPFSEHDATTDAREIRLKRAAHALRELARTLRRRQLS